LGLAQAPTWLELGNDEHIVTQYRDHRLSRPLSTLGRLILTWLVIWAVVPPSLTSTGWIVRIAISVVIVGLAAFRGRRWIVVTNERIAILNHVGRIREHQLSEIPTIVIYHGALARWLRSGSIVLKGFDWRLAIGGVRNPKAIFDAIVSQRQATTTVDTRSWAGRQAPAMALLILLIVFDANSIISQHRQPATQDSAWANPSVATTDARIVLTAYLNDVVDENYQDAYGLLCVGARQRFSGADLTAYLSDGPRLVSFHVLIGTAQADQVVLTVEMGFADNADTVVQMTVDEQDDGMRVCDGPGMRAPA
jgi:hypothetical protein